MLNKTIVASLAGVLALYVIVRPCDAQARGGGFAGAGFRGSFHAPIVRAIRPVAVERRLRPVPVAPAATI